MALAATGVLELPYQASAAVTRMRFVVVTGDQTCAQASVAGSRVLGVARLSVSTAEAAKGKGPAVQVLGVAYVESGAAVARNAEVATDDEGRAVPGATGDRVAGIALKAASDAGEWIPVLLCGAAQPIVPA